MNYDMELMEKQINGFDGFDGSHGFDGFDGLIDPMDLMELMYCFGDGNPIRNSWGLEFVHPKFMDSSDLMDFKSRISIIQNPSGPSARI